MSLKSYEQKLELLIGCDAEIKSNFCHTQVLIEAWQSYETLTDEHINKLLSEQTGYRWGTFKDLTGKKRHLCPECKGIPQENLLAKIKYPQQPEALRRADPAGAEYETNQEQEK